MNTSRNSAFQYEYSSTLSVDAPSYVVRQADRGFYEALKAGQFCYVFNARKMGKSSLMIRTMQRLQAEGIGCALIDITMYGCEGVTLEQWYYALIKILADNFKISFDLRSWWREHELLSPLVRFSEFIDTVLLTAISQNIVIFVDEIDSVLSLNFSTDDFFAFIRACYNQRVHKPQYKRLTWALLGVATPCDLIKDKKRTPFNIGRAIELNGFGLAETKPLAKGLEGKVSNPTAVLREVLNWTGGQPFLTQKVCSLIPVGVEASWVEEGVRRQIIENWESQDDPEHLRTIRDRILNSKQRTSRLLGLYQQILAGTRDWEDRGDKKDKVELPQSLIPNHQSPVPADDSPEQVELRLSGLVVKREGYLKAYNRIYESVFNLNWIEQELAKLRPYCEAFTAWKASGCKDESRLLVGQALQEALAWAKGKSLSALDYQFLYASQEFERRLEKLEAEIKLEAQKQANLTLTQANLTLKKAEAKAKRRVRIGSVILAISLGAAIIAGVLAVLAGNALQEARQGIALERAGASALREFEFAQIEALLTAMESGQELKELVKDGRPLEKYPAISPLLALQTILNNIHEHNQFKAHRGQALSVSFSPDGKRLATAGDDTARLWNLSGQQLAVFNGHQGAVRSVSFSPDGKRLATAAEDGTARLWNLSGQQLAVFNGHQSAVRSVSFSPDGKRLATAAEDGTARLWDLSGQQLAEFKGHQGWVRSVSFSPDGKRLATAAEDGTARLWNLSGQQLAVFNGHQRWVNSVSFSPDGKMLATAGNDGTARLWNLFTGQQLREFKEHHGSVESVSFSPDSKMLATTGSDTTAQLWNLSTGQQLREFKGGQDWVNSVSFSPDGKTLATAAGDGIVRLWNLSGQQLAEFKGYQGSVESVNFSPDGKLFATVREDGTPQLWNLSSRQQLAELKGYQGSVESMSFSSDGKLFATVGEDDPPQLWNLSGQQLAVFNGHQDAVRSMSFSPDGKRLATAAEDGTARLWNLSGQQLTEFKGHRGWVNSVSFSPNGKMLATAGNDGTARLWNLSTGQQLREFKEHQGQVNSVSFTPDGKALATTGSDGTARLWNLSGQQLAEFKEHHGSVRSMTFSPDGKSLATAGIDGTVRLWNLSSGQQLAEFKGYQDSVRSMSFSPDGKTLAIVGHDATAILWRIEGLNELLSRGCNWLKDYFFTYPEKLKTFEVCQKMISARRVHPLY
jgi:WD40 repeat protein